MNAGCNRKDCCEKNSNASKNSKEAYLALSGMIELHYFHLLLNSSERIGSSSMNDSQSQCHLMKSCIRKSAIPSIFKELVRQRLLLLYISTHSQASREHF